MSGQLALLTRALRCLRDASMRAEARRVPITAVAWQRHGGGPGDRPLLTVTVAGNAAELARPYRLRPVPGAESAWEGTALGVRLHVEEDR